MPGSGSSSWSGRAPDARAMGGMRRLGRVAVLAAALPVSGCAAVFGGYDLAPNGLPRDETAIRRGLASEPEATHEAVIEGERELPDDDLLRLLYAGVTGRYAGRYTESTQLLDVASYLSEDRVTTSISRQALSFITSDRALAYVPSRTERLMIPYIAALGFLEAGDLGGAVVEARRIEALLDRFDEGVPPDRQSDGSRFLHYLAATIFDAAGETNAAAVAYRRAEAPDTVAVPEAFADVPRDSLGEVVVVVERGFVPHRVEQSVVLALPPFQVKALTDGSAAEKAAAAADAAARILLYGSRQYGDRGPFYTDRSYRRPLHISPWRDQCDRPGVRCEGDDLDPYLLRISWPVLFQEPVASAPVRIRADGAERTSEWQLDVGAGVRRDFADERSTILARTVFRAATKMALSSSAEKAVKKEDEAAGEIVGLLVNLGTLLTERADTRSWHLLPGSVDLVRLRLPAGVHDLRVETDGWLDRGDALGSVQVRAGQTTFVAHRLWQ